MIRAGQIAVGAFMNFVGAFSLVVAGAHWMFFNQPDVAVGFASVATVAFLSGGALLSAQK